MREKRSVFSGPLPSGFVTAGKSLNFSKLGFLL